MSTLNGTTVRTISVDETYDYDLDAGFYESVPSKPITIPTYKTFRQALTNTSAIQTISRRG